jgi:DNA-binding MarR family transcriptional regulator
MGRVDTRTDLAAQLSHVMGRFGRQLRRSAASGCQPGGLPESQTELLRLVARWPGVSVNAAAAELGLVPNTASTLVSKLVGDGMLARDVDAGDRRVGRLRLTESAQQAVDASKTVRRTLLTDVLSQLDDTQITALTSGLQILEEMTQMLRERQP